MEHWIVYDVASGDERWRGSGSYGTAAQQVLPEGLALAVVPAAAIVGETIDLDLYGAFVMARIDAEAEQVRLRFVTPGAGQAMTYARKEAEARAWLADGTTVTPFLSAEAAATGVTVGEIAADVIQHAEAWSQIGSAIEGMRMGAKVAVSRATTLGAMITAGTVNWSAFGG